MVRERVFTLPLLCFLAVVGGVLVCGLWDRCAPVAAAAAVQRLVDGDLERAERRRLLRVVEEQAAADRPGRLAAAMAAVALDDQDGYARQAALLGGGLPVQEGDAPFLDRAGLGDPVLSALLQAMVAEATRKGGAAELYAQVEASSRLFHLPLAGRLAAAGLQRLR